MLLLGDQELAYHHRSAIHTVNRVIHIHGAGFEQQRKSKGHTELNEEQSIDSIEQRVAPYVGCIALSLNEQRPQEGLDDSAGVPVLDKPCT